MGYQNRISTRQRRKYRVRNKIKQTGRPRLSVHKTNQHIYAQVIDDTKGETVAYASTLELRDKIKSTCNVDAAKKVGEMIAQRAVKAGYENVVYDRGAFLYHGRIKALADTARDNGMDF